MSGNEDTFLNGKVFIDIKELKDCIVEYNARNFTNFVITSNHKKAVVIQCKHSRERKSECSGRRPRQHYNFLGCKAFVRLYTSQENNDQTMQDYTGQP